MTKPNTETVKVMVRVRPMSKDETNNGKLDGDLILLQDTRIV